MKKRMVYIFTLMCGCVFFQTQPHISDKKTSHNQQQTNAQTKKTDTVDAQRAKIKKDYKKINTLIEKLSKIEMIHNTAIAAQELINETQKECIKQNKKEQVKRFDHTKKYVNLAIKEVEESRKNIDKSLDEINKKLENLFNGADGIFEKPHLKIAKENISKAMQEYNEIILKKDEDKE